MGDTSDIYYIGDLARLLGLSQRTIRYYEELGFIRPRRTDGRFRQYSERDADILRTVLRFKDLGMSLEEIHSLIHPADDSVTNETMGKLRSSLSSRRSEFESKVKEYEEGIAQIDRVLDFLSRCRACADPEVHVTCERCLKERKDKGEDMGPMISSLLHEGDAEKK